MHELQAAVWDTKATKPKLLAGSPDHMMDAFDYALTPWYSQLLRQANPYYFNKYDYRKEFKLDDE